MTLLTGNDHKEQFRSVDWDDAFSNAAHIPDGTAYPDRWRRSSSHFRATHKTSELDLTYGPHPRQKYDLFRPEETVPEGLVLFIHGGYWLDFDKSYWSHLAQGTCQLGWVMGIPSYILAPEAKISEITQMIALAIEQCAELVDGPIVLVGHSAGGHLVTRMTCESSPLTQDVQARIVRVVSISGLHDLRMLMYTQMNTQLQLDDNEAVAESPALQSPLASSRVVCWVGADERPEFQRQAALLRESWQGQVQEIKVVVAPNRHHFNVIEPLSQRDSMLTHTLVGDG